FGRGEWPEGVGFEAANGTLTTGIEVLEERQTVLAGIAVAVAVADIGAGQQDQRAIDRPVAAELVGELVILLGRSRKCNLGSKPLERSAGRVEVGIGGVARPRQLCTPGMEGAAADHVVDVV